MADATISDVYTPLEANLKEQATANANRYAQNQADIASITGVLSQIAPQDKVKINQQFAASIQQQQEALAGRTAEARKGQLAGQQGAATAAAEMGSGDMPVPTDSYSNQAINQGIAQSNQAQTNWAGLMGAMQQQQLNNVDATQAGYGFQTANALQNLFRNRQTQIGGETQAWNALQSQKAQSQLSAQAAGAEMAQESALAEAKNQTALQVAQTAAAAKLQGAQTAAAAKLQGAQIAANARTGAAAISAAAKANKSKEVKVTSPVSWEKAIRSKGTVLIPGLEVGGGIYRIKNSVAQTLNNLQAEADKAAKAKKHDINATGKVDPNTLYKTWLSANKSLPAATKDLVWDAIKKGYYKTW